jgi:hypothetical protein
MPPLYCIKFGLFTGCLVVMVMLAIVAGYVYFTEYRLGKQMHHHH